MIRIRKEVQIALVAIVGVVILFFGMKFLKGLTLLSTANTFYATFKDISGMTKSSPVYANGFKIGTVRDIVYDYTNSGNIVVELDLEKAFLPPEGTVAEIASDLMGNVKVVLVMPGSATGHMEVGDTINGDMAHGTMDKVAGMIPNVEKMLPKLDSIMASLNVLLADPAIRNSLHNVERITNDLTTTTGQLNSLMAEVNGRVPSMLSKADNVLGNADKLTKNLSEIDVAATMTKVDATLDNVHEMTEKLNSNEGTLGLLMNDRQLYDNLTSTMRNADSLVIDLKAHPKRYVHFSLFGRKNK